MTPNTPKPRTRRRPARSGAPAEATAGSPADAPAGLPVPADDGNRAVLQRVDGLSRDVGWLLVTAGMVGVLLPGVIGTPLVIIGTAVLWPGTGKRLEGWLESRSPRLFNAGLKQVNRFLDDLERRYPKR